MLIIMTHGYSIECSVLAFIADVWPLNFTSMGDGWNLTLLKLISELWQLEGGAVEVKTNPRFTDS